MTIKQWIGKQILKAFGSSYLFPNGSVYSPVVTWVSDDYGSYIKNGYLANDVVYSISQIVSEKIKVAPWGVYKITDESSLKQYLAETRKKDFDHKRALDLKTKALKPYDGDKRLTELLQWPNEHESFSDLVAHSSISKMMTGNRFIEAGLLDMGANMGKPFELRLLPPHLVGIVNNGKYPMRSASYILRGMGVDIPMALEAVMHDKYYNPNADQSGSHLYGLSPLKAARMRLTNDNSANEASTKSFQNMGPGGVGWIDDERLTGEQATEQAGAIKKKWIEEYSGPSNAKKIVVSGYKMGFTEMGLSPTDLNILQQQKWNLVLFCNIWNFPHLLLLPDHATDNNAGWAERALTSRCALPLITSFRNNFNRKLYQDWGYKGQNIYVDYDQSVYTELDVNRKEAADWMAKMPLSIRHRYELANLEIPEEVQKRYGDKLDTVIMPSGMVALEEMGGQEPITDDEGNDYE